MTPNMTSDSPNRRVKTTRRGLATVAFLKARFDEGRDHLDMFQPLVEDEIRRYRKDDIDLSGFQAAVRKSTGVSIPTDILRTLLRRAAKKKLVTRQGGRFLRGRDVGGDPNLAGRMEEFTRAHLVLASQLREYAGNRGVELKSDDDALAALMGFLDAHHIGVVLGQRLPIGSSDGFGRLNQAVAAFVKDILGEGGRLGDALEDIVKGLIVHNALLLRDIPITERNLDRLTVFLDTGVLLHALGYAGPAEEQAVREGLDAVRAAGAQLYAFERTVDEIDSILRVYEAKLGSTAGARSLRGTPLTFHFFRIRATPADIRQEIALIRGKLAKLGIRTREFPKHIPKYTEDEEALAEELGDPHKVGDSDGTRVWHDVRAVSAVITLRSGARPNRISSARFVFASSSSLTVANAIRWYRESYPQGLEPIIHFRAVTNAAWVLRPVDASRVPMQELIAVCLAVLQPSPEVWSRFVGHLERLVASGELNNDESIAVLAHQFTRIDLGNVESEEDVEATTVLEIVERVRESQESSLRSQLGEKQREVEASRSAAANARAQADVIRSRAKAQTERIATFIAGAIYGALCLVLLIGAVRAFPLQWSAWAGIDTTLSICLWACLLAFYVVALLDIFSRRFHVLNVFDRLKALIARGLESIGTPGEEYGDS